MVLLFPPLCFSCPLLDLLCQQEGLVPSFKLWQLLRLKYWLVVVCDTQTHTHAHTYTHVHTRTHTHTHTHTHTRHTQTHTHTPHTHTSSLTTDLKPTPWACALLLLHISGYAFTASICKPHLSCAIAEHYGLQSGFTVAHLTGLRWPWVIWINDLLLPTLALPPMHAFSMGDVTSDVVYVTVHVHKIKHVKIINLCTYDIILYVKTRSLSIARELREHPQRRTRNATNISMLNNNSTTNTRGLL